jgi:hypothetical protein
MLAHLAALRARPPRPLPGSYAWPRVRVRAEQLFADGTSVRSVDSAIRRSDYGISEPPSLRTVRRWRSQRRWLAAARRSTSPP